MSPCYVKPLDTSHLTNHGDDAKARCTLGHTECHEVSLRRPCSKEINGIGLTPYEAPHRAMTMSEKETSPLFWPWVPRGAQLDFTEEAVETTPVITSASGMRGHVGSRRACEYRHYTHATSGREGSVRYVSLRSTVKIALLGSPVWSIRHMLGSFSISYTWGYH